MFYMRLVNTKKKVFQMRLLKTVLIIFLVSHFTNAQNTSKTPYIEVTPETSLYHKSLDIKIANVPPNQRVTLTLKTIDARSKAWKSTAVYISNNQGAIDLSEQPSIGGTYTGMHPMGLFWSLQSNEHHQIATNSGFDALLEVSINDKLIATKTIHRKSARELEYLHINAYQKRDSIIANYYLPSSTKKLPAIIFIGGSGGGFRQERSSLYASEGYAVLNLKYFRHDSLPEGIVEIPLEYVAKAHKWLQQQPEIDQDKIGIIGRSRGSELAMLYATKYDDLQFVIAQAPSSVVWFGWADKKSSWSYKGIPFPYAVYTDEDSERIEKEFIQKNIQYRDGPKFLSAFSNKEGIEKALIPVEDIQCPILFISGEDDQVWPATMMSEMMVKRLQERKFNHEFMHLSYPNAGHNFAGGGQGCGIPYLPAEDYSKGGAAKGGTDKGNALASIASWEAILKFIERSIKE